MNIKSIRHLKLFGFESLSWKNCVLSWDGDCQFEC